MNPTATKKSATSLSHVIRQSITGQEPDVLTNIYRDDTNITIWQRPLSVQLIRAAKQLLINKPNFKSAMVVSTKNRQEHLNEAFGAHEEYRVLSEDISKLVDMFCCLFDLKEVGLRITALDHAMCPKFHVDQVPCRLVTTYYGIATQWLDHRSVDRSKLGAGSGKKSDQASGLYKDLKDIHELKPGDVALLKGEAWKGNENAGLVHRSPAVSSSALRLLCTLDFVN